MSLVARLLGRPIATRDAEHERIGALRGIPLLGLDALASAAYGPEAALTLLIPLGADGFAYLVPIIAVICAILVLVALSYRQTIAAYPDGGGSFIVARENLGRGAGLLAASALALDYILNVAVGISAGIGALSSAIPELQPHSLALCLVLLAMITIVNLRGIRDTGIAFALPTFAFVVLLGAVIVIGIARTLSAGGHPHPLAPLPMPHAVAAGGAWLAIRAFASGTTAMTGVEAVADAVPMFEEPRVSRARRTLLAIVAILIALLAGIAYLSRAYGITATEPGKSGYQSVLSLLTGAVEGRGVLYDLTMAAVLAVLALSANTSFADFPRLCRFLAIDSHLPKAFAERGRRLVFTHGVIVLAVISAALLLGFGGVTDRLIPLFAIGALLAFTLSQAGMVAHWRKQHRPRAAIVNLVGAIATGVTVIVVAISKFVEGAWLIVLVLPVVWLALRGTRRHYLRLERQIETALPIAEPDRDPPIAVVAAGAWNKVTRHGLALAQRIAKQVYVAQIASEHASDCLAERWDAFVTEPCRRNGRSAPELIVLRSDYREFFAPFIELVHQLERDHPGRMIAVVLPELVVERWYRKLFHGNRARLLHLALLANASDRVIIVVAPFHERRAKRS